VRLRSHIPGGTSMPLTQLKTPTRSGAVPPDVRRFLREADRRIERYQTTARSPAFVPSDYPGGYAVLRHLAAGSHLRGRVFCEWGSGFGVVTALAAMLGFEAHGIEADSDLVSQAENLAGDFGVDAAFVRGSFVPPGGEDRVYAGGEYAWMTTESDFAYEELGLGPADLDVVFAYPWPDEEAVVQRLFAKYAGPGAVLVTYHGNGEFRARRKTGRRKG
jgi:hypothetical protein